MKFESEFKHFHWRKYIWKCHLGNVGHFSRPQSVNSSWSGGIIWCHWTVSALVTNHYLNQCWIIVNRILRNKFQWNLNKKADFYQEIVFENLPAKLRPFRSTLVILLRLTYWGRDKMAAISQTIFSNALSWMKMFQFRSKFHRSLFLRVQLTIFHHWLTPSRRQAIIWTNNG